METVRYWLETGQQPAWNILTPVPQSQGLLLPVGQPFHSQWGAVLKMEGTNTKLGGSGWCLVPCVPMERAVHGSVGADHQGTTTNANKLVEEL